MRVEIYSDNCFAGANALILKCKNGDDIQSPTYTSWGTWSSWYMCPDGEAVVGMETKIEHPDANDDAALIDVKMFCARYWIQP